MTESVVAIIIVVTAVFSREEKVIVRARRLHRIVTGTEIGSAIVTWNFAGTTGEIRTVDAELLKWEKKIVMHNR